jgi:hypothetical protein
MRHLEGQLTQPGEHGLGLEVVGVIAPTRRARVGTGTEKFVALNLGSFVDRDAQGFVGSIQAVLKQHRIGRFQRVGFDSHRHGAYTPFSMSWPQTHCPPPYKIRRNGIYSKQL